MLDQPRFPLFVIGDNEALVFLNQRDVGVFVERDDVADGIYHGFDFDGRALNFASGLGQLTRGGLLLETN
ncbi:hypothetical protein DND132_1903 [Pseudodesulfovibrio mercurii]|uniref:Uncharacterized protein n=1 Tax=Pseudodesulfovibrio mercurii TaxID=641491 RepID=F0JGR9_9BACT|nr:hypothetical protein [Pseudodesulfovibrio mercurii]EGB15109.1 hypothetical protein DND132_1903 [Pseudodesulfovibrio mercurii]